MAAGESEEIALLHREACQRGEDSYIDPLTGLVVFTEVHHIRRGRCCGSGCRHCPYQPRHHKNSTTLSQVVHDSVTSESVIKRR